MTFLIALDGRGRGEGVYFVLSDQSIQKGIFMHAFCKRVNSRADHAADAVAQFFCRCLCEGDNEDVTDGNSLLNQEAEKYTGDGVCFSRSSARLDQISFFKGAFQEIKITIVISVLIQNRLCLLSSRT